MSKGTRLDPNWELPDEWRQDALDRGMPDDKVDMTAECFRNYWIARTGQIASKLDWRATWRNWVIRDVESMRARQVDLPPARDVRDITTPERSQNYHTIAKENLAAMRRRVR